MVIFLPDCLKRLFSAPPPPYSFHLDVLHVWQHQTGLSPCFGFFLFSQLLIQRPILAWITPWQERYRMWTQPAFDLPFYANPKRLKGFFFFFPGFSQLIIVCCVPGRGGRLPAPLNNCRRWTETHSVDLTATVEAGTEGRAGMEIKYENERFALSAPGREQRVRTVFVRACAGNAWRFCLWTWNYWA